MVLAQFLDFLPIGLAYRPLCELTRYYASTTLDFSFRLTLRAKEVPGTRLNRGSWLGWTTWLSTKPVTLDDSQVRLKMGLPQPGKSKKEIVDGNRPKHRSNTD